MRWLWPPFWPSIDLLPRFTIRASNLIPDMLIAAAQQDGFGAMLSFELSGVDQVRHFVEAVEVFTLAESLGGVQSLVAHSATMTQHGRGGKVCDWSQR